jgi:hypothetical protein
VQVPVPAESTVSGAGVGDFFDAYFRRVGGMLYGMADSFKITGEAGPQIKASFTAFSIKPEVTIGNFSGGWKFKRPCLLGARLGRVRIVDLM